VYERHIRRVIPNPQLDCVENIRGADHRENYKFWKPELLKLARYGSAC
jgi:hypothetical protein